MHSLELLSYRNKHRCAHTREKDLDITYLQTLSSNSDSLNILICILLINAYSLSLHTLLAHYSTLSLHMLTHSHSTPSLPSYPHPPYTCLHTLIPHPPYPLPHIPPTPAYTLSFHTLLTLFPTPSLCSDWTVCATQHTPCPLIGQPE